MSSTLQTKTGVSREELVGKLTAACHQVPEAKSLGMWLHENKQSGEGRIKIPIVKTGEGLKVVIVYPENDLSYGERISSMGISHQLAGIAEDVGVDEIVFYSDRGWGRPFAGVEDGDAVEVMSLRETANLPGSVVEII